MGRPASFEIVKNAPREPLYLRDLGPWEECLTVTNDAERVVNQLVGQGYLPPGRRLIVCDSEGEWDEFLVKDGAFAGFRSIVQDEGDGGP